MLASIIRFWANGWIDKLYLQPDFFFSYRWFEWVKPIGIWTYAIFVICALAALMVAFGFKYRLAIITFFLSFTYIELMDKTTYLNHYYFVSLVSFLMIFIPANAYFSMDARRNPNTAYQRVPQWSIDAIKLMLAIVYLYAGLAKLNSDWLVDAQPLSIWLRSKWDIPLMGDLLQERWAHYAFSWSGALYDLTIPFLLLYRKTRVPAFIAVVVFHVLTRVLFPIGMFPYIMIVSALIFFDATLHKRILNMLGRLFRVNLSTFENSRTFNLIPLYRLRVVVLSLFFVVQLALPFRHLLYPGELFWTEEGYRFSWRVMLMEKAGYDNLKIVDSQTGKRFYVDNTDFLTTFQEKQMATQPDFILEYAHYLKRHFESQGHQNIQVFVESYVSLNGRGSQPYIDPDVDLTQLMPSFKHKKWILPFNDEIKGL